jgi:hypothetical protein
VDQTWTEGQVCSLASQVSTPPTYGLRSREPMGHVPLGATISKPTLSVNVGVFGSSDSRMVWQRMVGFMAQADPLTAKWRRFDVGVDRMRSAVGAAHSDEMHDAVNAALNALYELWEYWRANAPPRSNGDDAFVRGDIYGETTAALVYARGAQYHRVFQEHGDLTGTYSDTYYDHYGSWLWEHFSDPKYPVREGWYKAHVAGHEVVEPFKAARQWLSAQPEL